MLRPFETIALLSCALSGCTIGLADQGGASGSGRGRIASNGNGCAASYVERVRGQVVDQAGAPVAGAKAQLCVRLVGGELECLTPADSGSDGRFEKSIGEGSRCMEHLAVRVLVPGSDLGTTYCPLEALDVAGGTLDVARPLRMVTLGAPASLPPLGDEDAPRQVELSSGLVMEVTPSALWGEYGDLRAAEVPLEDGACFLDAHPEVLGLFAFAPEGSTGDAPFWFHFPERTGLPSGARVELLVLGGLGTRLADGTTVEEAELAVFGTGTVVDGVVRSDPGSELPYLSWLAYREAP